MSPGSHPLSERLSLLPGRRYAFLQRFSLGFKVNLVVTAIFGMLLATIIVILNVSTATVITRMGQERARQHALLVQGQINQAAQILLKDTDLLANAPTLATIAAERDVERAGIFLLSNAVPTYFTDIDLYDIDGERIVDLDAETASQVLNDQSDNLMRMALAGNKGTGIVLDVEEDEDEEAEADDDAAGEAGVPRALLIAAAVPVHDPESGALVGVLTAARALNDDFLEALTLDSQDIGLLLIYEGNVVSSAHIHPDAQLAGVGIDPAAVQLAMSGTPQIADHLVRIQGVPRITAYVPLGATGETNAVMAIIVGLEPLAVFQHDFTTGLASTFGLLLLIGLAGMFFFIRQSVTRPLGKLEATAAIIASGDYSQQVAVKSADEVGRLGVAFNTMAERIAERTEQLEQALTTAQEAHAAAEAANTFKSQFIANMSHELRTPLNSIINFTRIVASGMRGPVTEGQLDYLGRVRGSGEHLLGLINDILDLSKIEAGRMELYTETCHLDELVQSVMATATGLTKGKPIELHLEIAPDLPPVQVDRTRIRQVLLNLLSNAAKFTESGSITVKVAGTAEQLAVSVTDTGIGIAPEHLALIFEEFRQIDSSSNRTYDGTGLGLTICKRLVELHGGDIQVESTLGVGSTFTFRLPLSAEATMSVRSQRLPPVVLVPDPARPTILVIDDDQATTEIVTRYLERDGYTVCGVTDSRRALDEARRLRPAAIILDILMPYKDGWELLSELKADTDLQTVPVILYTIVEEQQLGFHLGAHAYLVKPINEERLRATVNQLVGRDAKILVIDDDPNILEMVTHHLAQTHAYQVTTALGGRAGLAQVALARPDLIILDLMMPEVDGFTVLAQLNHDPDLRTIPIIILTAKDLAPHERRTLNQRVNGLLTKGGTTPEQLLHKVSTLLQPIPSRPPEAQT